MSREVSPANLPNGVTPRFGRMMLSPADSGVSINFFAGIKLGQNASLKSNTLMQIALSNSLLLPNT